MKGKSRMNKLSKEKRLQTPSFFSKETCLGISAVQITPKYFSSVEKKKKKVILPQKICKQRNLWCIKVLLRRSSGQMLLTSCITGNPCAPVRWVQSLQLRWPSRNEQQCCLAVSLSPPALRTAGNDSRNGNAYILPTVSVRVGLVHKRHMKRVLKAPAVTQKQQFFIWHARGSV